eukprot:1464317-Rhodomonas_salina.3
MVSRMVLTGAKKKLKRHLEKSVLVATAQGLAPDSAKRGRVERCGYQKKIGIHAMAEGRRKRATWESRGLNQDKRAH